MAARWRCSFPNFSPLHWQHYNRSGDGRDRTQVGSSGSSCRSGIVPVRVVVSRTARRNLNEAMQALDAAAASVVRRAQSSASRFVRNVLAAVGQPTRRMVAFQVPEGVFVSAAMVLLP